MCEEADALQSQTNALRDVNRHAMGQIDFNHPASLIEPHIHASFGALASDRFYLAAQQSARLVKHGVFRPEEKLPRTVKPICDMAQHRSAKARATVGKINRQAI